MYLFLLNSLLNICFLFMYVVLLFLLFVFYVLFIFVECFVNKCLLFVCYYKLCYYCYEICVCNIIFVVYIGSVY